MKNDLSPSALMNKLLRTGYRTRKRLGQHFLIDEAILEDVASATQADADTTVLEIGPGPGTLTSCLCKRAGQVIAIERDERLRQFHDELCQSYPNLKIIYGDALRLDLWDIAQEEASKSGKQKIVLAGNIPFQITSPLLFAQTGPSIGWSRIVLMIQKEVADRILAGPNNRDYGILTIKLSYWWKARKLSDIPASMFSPPPKVDATTIALESAAPSLAQSDDTWPGLSKFVDRCFNQRRKKLYNSPGASNPPSNSKESFVHALDALGIEPDVRAENLSPEDYIRLYMWLREEQAASR